MSQRFTRGQDPLNPLRYRKLVVQLSDFAAKKIPTVVTPCPIVSAVAEVRFDSEFPQDAVFGVAYAKLRSEFPTANPLAIMNLPSAVRSQEPQFRYAPHYRLENDSFVAQLGPRIITVGIKTAYPGWKSLSQVIHDTFEAFHATGVMAQPRRFGLRYINFFEVDILQHLRLELRLGGDSLPMPKETQVSTVIHDGDSALHLQVKQNITLHKPERNANYTGSVIDIDVYNSTPNDGSPNAFFEFLSTSHSKEKQLFFGLVKSDFLNTFNPKYSS